MFDSAHRPVAGPFAQTTTRPVVGPEVPVRGPTIKSKDASGARGSNFLVRDAYKIRAASEAPPKKSLCDVSGIWYFSVTRLVRSILRIGCITNLLPTPSPALDGRRGRRPERYSISVVTSCAQRTKSNTVGTLRIM